MRNREVAEFYDALYTACPDAFKGDPLPITKTLAERLGTGKILDAAAAQGRDSIFLASRGFDVHANDISRAAVARLEQNAAEAGVALRVTCADISAFRYPCLYDAIICNFVLHHLARRDAEAVLANMQNNTVAGGFNVVVAFSKIGAFFAAAPDTDCFFLDDTAHLERLYAGWRIHDLVVDLLPALDVHEDGIARHNLCYGVLAQKT
jgi:tellurite methyltransferase